MQRVFLLLLCVLTSCAANVIQTRGQMVVCSRSGRTELSSVIDPRVYTLVYTRKHYELRLNDTRRTVARYDHCQMEILPK